MNGTLTVNTKAITVTADSGQTKVYGAADPGSYTYALTSGSPVSGDGFTGALSRVAGENVGNYAIQQNSLTVSDGNSGSNYTLTYVGANFAITAKPITVTPNTGQSKVYGASDPSLTYTLTSGSLVGGDSLSGALARNAGENVSTYSITQGTLANSNYSITFTTGRTFAITAKPLTITAGNRSKSYGDTLVLGSSNFTTSALAGAETIDSVTLSSSGAAASAHVSGSPYTITPSAPVGSNGFVSSNYAITYTNGSLTVNALPVTVTADSGQSKVYGASNPTYTYSITSGGLVNSDSFSGSLSRAAGENVGSYGITIGSLTLGTDYNMTFVPANFAITPRALTITASNQSKTYGSTFAFTGTEFGSSGLQNGETVGSVTLASSGAVNTAGVTGSPFAITASAATGGSFTASNYTITYTAGSITVTPAVLTVSADNKSRNYGLANPTFTVTYSGFVNGEVLGTSGVAGGPTLSTAAGTFSVPGSYAIVATAGSLTSANYSFTLLDGTLTIYTGSLPTSVSSNSQNVATGMWSTEDDDARKSKIAATLTGSAHLVICDSSDAQSCQSVF